MLFGGRYPLLEKIMIYALVIIMPICIIGAILGIYLSLGKLKLKCPFCKAPGEVSGSKQDGLLLHCHQCGQVKSKGKLSTKFEIVNVK